jgi:hypothetical protein
MRISTGDSIRSRTALMCPLKSGCLSVISVQRSAEHVTTTPFGVRATKLPTASSSSSIMAADDDGKPRAKSKERNARADSR